ncbi:MAG TPA: hypothetical protein VKU82_07880, partial [Planctomycetaceae bacterium]|nr:hypothetical protein [Planctomycetaceae bacterium]
PVDRKILWARPLESRAGAQNVFGRNQNPLQPMQQAAGLANRHAAIQGATAAGALSLANEEFVGFQGRRTATLLDALSGEVCWDYKGVRPGTIMLGGEETVFLRSPEKNHAVALRAGDGKKLDVKNLGETLDRAVHVVHDHFVMSGVGKSKSGLRLFDPIQGRDLWTIDLAKGTLMSLLENDRMALLEPETDGKSSKFAIVDLETGERQTLGTLGADELKGRTEAYALSDSINVYLLINKGANQNYYSEQVPFVRASGLVMAFDPVAKRQRWKQTVQVQNLMLERLAFSPFLVFSSRKYEQKGKVHFWSLHLLAIDKLSGAKLLDEKSAAQPGFRSVTVSAVDRFVELRSYNERVRLYPVEKSAAAGQSGGD